MIQKTDRPHKRSMTGGKREKQRPNEYMREQGKIASLTGLCRKTTIKLQLRAIHLITEHSFVMKLQLCAIHLITEHSFVTNFVTL